jgi:hypothetical protein
MKSINLASEIFVFVLTSNKFIFTYKRMSIIKIFLSNITYFFRCTHLPVKYTWSLSTVLLWLDLPIKCAMFRSWPVYLYVLLQVRQKTESCCSRAETKVKWSWDKIALFSAEKLRVSANYNCTFPLCVFLPLLLPFLGLRETATLMLTAGRC